MKDIVLVISLLMSACMYTPNSTLDITNGKPTVSHPAVVQLRSKGGTCTGTFIRPDVLLTAAHCIPDDFGPIVVPDRLAASSKTVKIPGYDIALVFFPELASEETLPLQSQSPREHDPVTLIGFGKNNVDRTKIKNGEPGIKRIGSNKIASIDGQQIVVHGTSRAFPEGKFSPDGQNANGAPGDSGGPLLNINSEIIGVASEIIGFGPQPFEHSARYVSMAAVKELIETQIATHWPQPVPSFVVKCQRHYDSWTIQRLLESYNPGATCAALYSKLLLRHMTGNSSLDFVGNPNLNQTLDLEIISDLNWVESLSISGLKMEHLDSLASFSNLEEISLEYIGLSNVMVLANNPTLRHISILEKNAPSVDPLRLLPNLQSLKINGVWQNLKPLARQILGGSWYQLRCIQSSQGGGENEDEISGENEVEKFFEITTLNYNEQRAEISYGSEWYRDSSCLGLPFLTLKMTRGIKSMAPTEDPLVFKLDFADKFVNLLLVNDDSGLSENRKTTFSNLCSYRLGVQTRCRNFEGFFSKFTSVKREGDHLYFAVPADGSTPQQRNKEFDSEEPPFVLNRSDRIEPKESTPPVL